MRPWNLFEKILHLLLLIREYIQKNILKNLVQKTVIRKSDRQAESVNQNRLEKL